MLFMINFLLSAFFGLCIMLAPFRLADFVFLMALVLSIDLMGEIVRRDKDQVNKVSIMEPRITVDKGIRTLTIS